MWVLPEPRGRVVIAKNSEKNRKDKSMPKRSIVDRLKAGEVLLMDGATGTELQRRGVNINKGATVEGGLGVWSAAANIDAPGLVRAIHEDYLKLGADIIISNNFYTTRPMMAMIGKEDQWEEYTRRAVELAKQARDAVNPEAYVAGGFAPFDPEGDYAEEFEAIARVLVKAGVDFLLPEYFAGDTYSDSPIEDCVTAVEACSKFDLPVFLGVCLVTEKGTMMGGESFGDLAAALKGLRVDCVLPMCCSAAAASACLPRLRKAFDCAVGAYAENEYIDNPKFGTSPDEPFFVFGPEGLDPQEYAKYAREWKKMGAQVIGGCCGTTPDHIRAIAPIVKG
jgi:homocysteine S-methyltransferase